MENWTEERKLARKPRRRGGKAKKRGLSRAGADSGRHRPWRETPSHTLSALNAENEKAVLETVIACDALLVSHADRCYPPVAAALDLRINASGGERVRCATHIQTVNSRQSKIKGIVRRRRSIATKYRDSNLRWLHLIALGERLSPSACLKAEMAKPCLRSAI